MRGVVTVFTNQIPARLNAVGEAIKPDMALIVYRAGALYRTRVRAKASGRPGPRAQTGDYRRGISQTNTVIEDVPTALVHTNSPQAARLEYGFTGVDAAGRYFDQPPYPHWSTAAEGLEEDLEAEARRAVDRAISLIWRVP